jgi:hypothetical protein
MKIFLHRGYWKDGFVQNSLDAFKKAFDLGYSIELDLKYSDQSKTIVIGHDIEDNECNFIEVLELSQKYNESMLALNIKQDGLSDMIKTLNIDENLYFCFDMSIPEYFKYKEANIPLAVRLSDFESPIFESSYYWLDSFKSEWWSQQDIKLPKGNIILVSPEIHGRPIGNSYKLAINQNFFGVCLDEPRGISHE